MKEAKSSERAYKALDIHFEPVRDSEGGIIAVRLPEKALQAKLETNHGGVVAFFLEEKLLIELISKMGYYVRRRRATGMLWTPGMPL